MNTPIDNQDTDITACIEAARGPVRDAKAFALLVDQHQAMIYGLIHATCGDWSEAQDLTQEVFLKAWEKLATLREPERFAPWLRQIARTVTLDSIRRRIPLAEAVDDVAVDDAPERDLSFEQTARAVNAAIGRLSTPQRSAIVLFHLRGLSYAEIAGALDEPIGTIRSHLNRGRRKLEELLRGRDLVAPLEELAMTTQLPADFTDQVVRFVNAAGAVWNWQPNPEEEGQTFGSPGEPNTADSLLKGEPRLAEADIYAASVVADVATITRLLQQDPSLARKPGGPRDWPPLLYLCYSQYLREHDDLGPQAVEAADVLLHAGADASAKFQFDKWGNNGTCLYGAARVLGNLPLTERIIAAGQDWDIEAHLYHAPSARDVDFMDAMAAGGMPTDRLSYLLRRMLDFENHAMVVWFLDHGADPDDRHPSSGTEETNLHWAIKRGRRPETVAAIIEAGGDVNARMSTTASIWPTIPGETALDLATRFHDQAVMTLLADHGANPATLDDAGQFIAACAAGDAEAAAALGKALGGVAALAAHDKEAITHVAQRGNAVGVETMLANGFSARQTGWSEFSALTHAAWMGHAAVVELLLDHGAEADRERALGVTRWAFDSDYINPEGDYDRTFRLLQTA